MTDIGTRKDVEQLVNQFYGRVCEDEVLAPVFAHVDWPHHLPVMYNFWSSVLLGDMSYSGNPLAKHMGLPVNREHFSRWLALFKETVDSEFSGPVAEEAISRAHMIASLFQHKMGLMKTG
jgi:hemoglobin